MRKVSDAEYKKAMREAKKEYDKWIKTPKVRAFLKRAKETN